MSYGGKGGGGSVEDGNAGGGGDAERDTEKKYEMLYEAELDPFKEFDSRKSASCSARMRLIVSRFRDLVLLLCLGSHLARITRCAWAIYGSWMHDSLCDKS